SVSVVWQYVLWRCADFLTEEYSRRLVLGIGVGHSYTTERRGMEWDRPLARMRRYLDVIDADERVRPAAPRMLAALGDGELRLAAERALGAHSYFVPVSHTARARSVLGDEPVLAVELGALLGADDATARAWVRAGTTHYLELPNYANNWRRLGFDDADVSDGGSDRLLESAFAWARSKQLTERVREHLDAGADHVCVQVVGAPDGDADTDLRNLAGLAPAVLA